MASPAGLRRLACPRGLLLQRLARAVPGGSRAVSISAQEMKERMKADLGPRNVADTTHDKREKRALRERRMASDDPLQPRVREVVACTSRREYDAGWEVYVSHEGAPHAALTNAALTLCAKARWIERAWGVWHTMPPGERSVIDYSVMLEACARCLRPSDAEQLFRSMEEAGVEPNLITYNSLLKVYATTSQPERAQEVFQSIPREMFEAAGEKTRQASYVTVMSAFARGGDYASTYRLFMQMLEDGVRPGIMHFTTLLSACARGGDGKTADGVFASMLAHGILPDVPSYTILAACNVRNLERCRQILSEVEGRGLQPSAHLQQHLLEAHVAAGDGRGARELLGRMDGGGLRSLVKFRRLESAVGRLP